MQLALKRPLLIVQEQDISKLIIRIDKLPIENLTNLTTGKIWQGVNNRLTEVTLSEADIADKMLLIFCRLLIITFLILSSLIMYKRYFRWHIKM